MSFHLSIETERTNDKCTPSPRCFPEHSRHIHIPYVTDTHCGLCVPHSKHFYIKHDKENIINSHISTNFALFKIVISTLRCLQYSHRWVEALAKYVLFVDLPFLFTNCFQFIWELNLIFLCKQNCTKWIRELCLKMLFKWIFIQDLRKLIEKTKQKSNKNNWKKSLSIESSETKVPINSVGIMESVKNWRRVLSCNFELFFSTDEMLYTVRVRSLDAHSTFVVSGKFIFNS